TQTDSLEEKCILLIVEPSLQPPPTTTTGTTKRGGSACKHGDWSLKTSRIHLNLSVVVHGSNPCLQACPRHP
ncbi:mCG145177, partial [Mus musculus]